MDARDKLGEHEGDSRDQLLRFLRSFPTFLVHPYLNGTRKIMSHFFSELQKRRKNFQGSKKKDRSSKKNERSALNDLASTVVENTRKIRSNAQPTV